MSDTDITRRALLGSSAAAVPALMTSQASAESADPEATEHVYQVQRSEAEWRAMLTEEEYGILRKGFTEWPKTSDLWQETRDGVYSCKGCGLPVFTANWNVQLDKGWVFFKHAVVDSVLLGIDGPVEQYGQSGMGSEGIAMVEVHCRRCASHLGHFLRVEGQNLHCINGLALNFEPASA